MKQTISYAGLTEEEKRAKAEEDIRFYLGDRFKKVVSTLHDLLLDEETTEEQVRNCIHTFIGIEGYPVEVLLELARNTTGH